jgi:uncharacterized membrane protein YphA (DoxX/SURF4 family)
MNNVSKPDYPKILITVLRMAIGWHFLYEGVSKLIIKDWTSFSYLANSTGPFSGFYHWLTSSGALVQAVDWLNIGGLILIGLALVTGLLSRVASIAGVLLLTLYYFAYPPFGDSLLSSGEGHVYIIDRNFIEAVALMVLILLKERGYGIENLIKRMRVKRAASATDTHHSDSRREVIRNLASVPFLGLMGWGAASTNRKYGIDALSGATIKIDSAALGELKGKLPLGKIGNHEISRLILGGNLIGGWAHSRDLLYVSSLFRAYNTERKIYETMILSENAGINTINIGFPTNALMAKYKRNTGSKLKVISQVAPNMETGDWYEQINKAIDSGADILQVQGNWCDWLVRDKKPEVIAAMIEKIRSQGYIAGLAAHTVDSLIYCEELGIIPDYYMKAMHHDNYWSAHPRENRVAFEVDGIRYADHNKFHDNIFDLFPDRTVEFINRVKIPVMGFKVLAAGAIAPEDGIRYAFENGADFVCLGMFDFQVIKDINICLDVLADLGKRRRELYG